MHVTSGQIPGLLKSPDTLAPNQIIHRTGSKAMPFLKHNWNYLYLSEKFLMTEWITICMFSWEHCPWMLWITKIN